MKSLRLLPLVALFLTPRFLSAEPVAPAFDASRAAANALRTDLSASPLLRDQQSKMSNALMDENPFVQETPGDSDIGQQLILKRNDKYEAFAVFLDSGYFFTDNAAQTRRDTRQDWFYVGGGALSWQPRITKRLYADLSVAQHWYVYNQYSDLLNYESGEAAAGLVLLMPELWNTLWHVHYYYQRITEGLDEDAVYQTHNIRLGVQKTVLFNRKNSLNIGLLASIALDASPSYLQRNEYSGGVTWNFKIHPTILFTAGYRLMCYDYTNFDGRVDWNNNFAVALAYRPRDWVELAGSWNYTINSSNKEAFSYNAQLAGPAVSVRMKF